MAEKRPVCIWTHFAESAPIPRDIDFERFFIVVDESLQDRYIIIHNIAKDGTSTELVMRNLASNIDVATVHPGSDVVTNR